MPRATYICAFSAGADEIKRPTYKKVRAAVLKAGRFSVFEATATMRLARIFTKLCEDPTLEIIKQEFPWTGVKERKVK